MYTLVYETLLDGQFARAHSRHQRKLEELAKREIGKWDGCYIKDEDGFWVWHPDGELPPRELGGFE